MVDSMRDSKRRLVLHKETLERRFDALQRAHEELLNQRLWVHQQLRRIEDHRRSGP